MLPDFAVPTMLRNFVTILTHIRVITLSTDQGPTDPAGWRLPDPEHLPSPPIKRQTLRCLSNVHDDHWIKMWLLSPSGDLGIGLIWDNHSDRTGSDHFSVRLLKSSSNWTKVSMTGPQLFSGWYQMILDVFQCSQLFFDVFSWVVTFMDNHPLCGHFFSGCPQLITYIL